MPQSNNITSYSVLSIKTRYLLLSLISSLIGSLFFNAHASSQAENSGAIVVTIKPLYSLVAQLTDGIEKPVLLMKQIQSPHHYTMRPSERRLLADARMIVWIGPQMESYLDKIIQQQDTAIVTAIQAKNLKLLDARTKNGHQHAAGEIDPDDLSIDPHIWLSTQNAVAISRHISRQLIITDPLNREQYETNLRLLEARITQLSTEIRTELENNKQAFITFHDAYQYFEEENQLNHIDTISFNEEAGVSLKHLRHIKTRMATNDVKCLVYQPPKPDIIDTLADRPAIKTIDIDPLGLDIEDEEQAWFLIMREMSQNFKQCLTP